MLSVTPEWILPRNLLVDDMKVSNERKTYIKWFLVYILNVDLHFKRVITRFFRHMSQS